MRTIIAAIALLTYLPAAAQTGYLPLEVDNEWTYYTLIDPPGEPYDTVMTGTHSVRDSVSIDDMTYVLFGHPNALADTVRADSQGRIWARIDGEDHLYFDFTASDDATYSFPDSDEFEYTVTVHRDFLVETRGGIFEDCIRFHFDIPEAVDDASTFYFARDVGIVYTSDGMGQPEWLYEARIGGRMLPTAVIPPEQFDFSAEVYPNPSSGAVTLRFDLDGHARTKVTIYDAAGRRLTTFAERRYPAGRNEVSWSADRQASGIYFVEFETDGHRVIRPLTIAR